MDAPDIARAVPDLAGIPGPAEAATGAREYLYERDRPGFLRDCHRRYGDVFRFDPNTVVLCDPDLARHVLVHTGREFRADGPVPDARLTSSAATAEWLRARQIIGHGLSARVLTEHTARLAGILESALPALARGRRQVGVARMQRLSALATADFCLGGAAEVDRRTGAGSADPSRLADLITESALAILAVLDRSFRLPSWLPDPGRRRLRRADRALSGTIARMVARRTTAEAPDCPRDLLDLLLAEDSIDEFAASHAMSTTLAASHAAPGTALSWMLATLAQRTDVQRRIRDEAADGLAAASTTGDLDLLPYTTATAREVLRLYPPIWLLGRQVAQPVSVGGRQLPAGAQVVFSPYLVQRDPRYWDDPDEFRPERFLDGSIPSRAYLPFGAGPRSCLGTRLALTQLVLTASLIARDYDLVSASPPVRPRFRTLLTPARLRLSLNVRASAT